MRKISEDNKVLLKNATLSYPLRSGGKKSIKEMIVNPFGFKNNSHHPIDRCVVALKDLNLDIKKGERIGVVGRNGSGKSTLLRVIAGIYPLTSGTVYTSGTIGTLLDISVGFEMESTGRENIYNRGLAMGMSWSEIRAKEGDIIDFANIGRFIDLPTRTYSSGMLVRLGFSVSTAFVPDILLIDEVFAAGDAEFYGSAIARIEELIEQAGIVVMVSHNMETIRQVSNRAIWMEGGCVLADGFPNDIVDLYQRGKV